MAIQLNVNNPLMLLNGKTMKRKPIVSHDSVSNNGDSSFAIEAMMTFYLEPKDHFIRHFFVELNLTRPSAIENSYFSDAFGKFSLK